MSWLNQILLVFSIMAAISSLVVQEWAGLALLPIYVSVCWAVFVIIVSVWLSCCLLRLTLKANSPIALGFVNKWICERLADHLRLDASADDKDKNTEAGRGSDGESQVENMSSAQECNAKSNNNATSKGSHTNEVILTRKEKLNIENMTREINAMCIEIWYKNISNDKSFPEEAQDLLNKFLTRLAWKASLIDQIKLTNKLANVLLLHLKEYRRYVDPIDRELFFVRPSMPYLSIHSRRALRRVEKGAATSVEEAYKYLHPGSRNASTLKHMSHRLVTVLAQEFLQWELTSSLPCKLLLSILATRLFTTIETISCPSWLIESLLALLEAPPKEEIVAVPDKQNVNVQSDNIYVTAVISINCTVIVVR